MYLRDGLEAVSPGDWGSAALSHLSQRTRTIVTHGAEHAWKVPSMHRWKVPSMHRLGGLSVWPTRRIVPAPSCFGVLFLIRVNPAL